MYSGLHRAILTRASLLLAAACSSSPTSDMKPGSVHTQPPSGNPSAATAGQAASANPGAGVGAVGGRGTTGAKGSAGTTPGGTVGTPGANGAGRTGAASDAAGSGTSTAGDAGNYFVSGGWHGYAWTSAQGMGSTITPMDFSTQTTGMPRCVKGSVGATTDYSGNAILGLNLNQDNGSSGMMTVTPTKAGVMIDVRNNVPTSPLRFQVAASIGGTEKTWCAVLSGAGGFIPWTSLKTECWGATGTAYAKEPISKAMLIVPGGTMAAVPFDFCLNGIAEADGPVGGGAAGSGALAGSGAAGMAAAGSGAVSGGGKYPPIQGGCDGFATRYWDCCKPHCGWANNVPSGTSPLSVCDRADNSLGGNHDAANSCEGGPAHLCHNMAPWAANDQLAYGYAAVASRGDICGKCYQLQFSGSSRNAGNDPGAAALGGKTMIVQAINVGGDVGSGQFDISIPGGGVGAFNACSSQWGVSASELGVQYGGFLARCKQQSNASDHQALKNCVMQSCKNVFEAKGLTELADGCRWYVEWFQAADNPSLKYAEIACPSELTGKGLRRTGNPGGACLR